MTNGDKNPSYKFSAFKMLRSIWANMFSNEWKGWLFINLFSYLLVGSWIAISKKYSIENAFIDYFVFSILFGTFGYLGFLTAKYRIFRLMNPIRGKPAFVIGITMLVISWGLAAYFLLLAAVEVAKYWM